MNLVKSLLVTIILFTSIIAGLYVIAKNNNKQKAARLHLISKDLQKKNKLNDAYKSIDQATKLDSNNSEYHYQKANILYELSSCNQAKQAIEKVIKVNSKEPEYFCLYSLILDCNHDSRKSIEAIKSAIALNPDESKYQVQLAALKYNNQEKEEAYKILEDVITKHPENALAWSHLGYAYRKNNLLEKNLELWKKAVEIYPNNPDNYSLLGDAYKKLGKTEEANKQFQKAFDINKRISLSQADENIQIESSNKSSSQVLASNNRTDFIKKKYKDSIIKAYPKMKSTCVHYLQFSSDPETLYCATKYIEELREIVTNEDLEAFEQTFSLEFNNRNWTPFSKISNTYNDSLVYFPDNESPGNWTEQLSLAKSNSLEYTHPLNLYNLAYNLFKKDSKDFKARIISQNENELLAEYIVNDGQVNGEYILYKIISFKDLGSYIIHYSALLSKVPKESREEWIMHLSKAKLKK